MSAKSTFILCALALTIQSAASQCTSRAAVAADPRFIPTALTGPYGIGAQTLGYEGLTTSLAYNGLNGWAGRGMAYDGLYPAVAPAMDFTPTSGGSLPVTSASAIPPTGISIVSETVFEGPLAVTGEIPFVGTTAMEGVVPSVGTGAINHECGNGINAMVSQTAAFGPEYAAATFAPAGAAIPPAGLAAPGLGYRAGWGGCTL